MAPFLPKLTLGHPCDSSHTQTTGKQMSNATLKTHDFYWRHCRYEILFQFLFSKVEEAGMLGYLLRALLLQSDSTETLWS